jgi:PAS domain S-box-containing protein
MLEAKMRDVSEKLAELAAHRSVIQSIAEREPLRQTLERLALGIESCTAGLMASLLLAEGPILRYAAGPSLPDEYNRAADGVPIGEGFGSCGTAAHRRKQVVVTNIDKDPLWKNYREIARRYGLASCWSTPIINSSGEVLGTFALYNNLARAPDVEELRLVEDFSQLAVLVIEQHRLAESLRASQQTCGELAEDLEVVVWEAEPVTHRLARISRRAEVMFGYPVERWLDDPDFWASILHDEDRALTIKRRQECIRELSHFDLQYRVRAADERIVWVRELGRFKFDRALQTHRMHGIMVNLSQQREAELERERYLRRLTREQALLRGVLEELPDGVILAEPSGDIVASNRRASQILEFPITHRDDLANHGLLHSVRADGRPYSLDDWPLARALSGESICEEMRFVRRNGCRGSLEVRAAPVRAADGRILACMLMLADVTERRRSFARQAVLADASARLVDSLDAQQTASSVAAVAVGQFASWCLIVRAGDHGSAERIAFAHRDPAKARLASAFDRLAALPGGTPLQLSQVLATGSSRLFAEIPEEAFEPGAVQLELARLLRDLGTASAMTVPMKLGDAVVGAILLGSDDLRECYSAPDLPIAEALGRRLATALENARRYGEGQAEVRRRDQFLAIAAHELRTPLTSLKLKLQTSLAELDEHTSAAIRPIRARIAGAERQSDRLAHLVDELFDVSTIYANRMRLQKQDLDLVAVLHSVVARFEEEAAAKRIDIAVHTAGPILGCWDRLRIEQVLVNLISNAMKYGAGRPIRITVGADSTNGRVEIEDQGIGMTAEVIKRIFQPFERGVAIGEYGGLGLGLYITDQIVRAHGGELQVRSEPGHGSTFTVELPRSAG